MSRLEEIKTFDELTRDIKIDLEGYRNFILCDDGHSCKDISLYSQCKLIYEQMINSAMMGNSFGCDKFLNQSMVMVNIRNGKIIYKTDNEFEFFINAVKRRYSYIAVCPTYDEDNLNELLMKVEEIFTELLQNINEATNVENKKLNIESYLNSIDFVVDKYFRKDNKLPNFSDDDINDIMSSVLVECVKRMYLPNLKTNWISTKEASIISGIPVKKIRSIFIETECVIAKKERKNWYMDLQSFIQQYIRLSYYQNEENV